MVRSAAPTAAIPIAPRPARRRPRRPIADEHPPDAKISNARGTLSMANTGRPNSGSCQFFINVVDNPTSTGSRPANSRHPVFAKVIEGMDVVDKISKAPRGEEH